MKKPILLTKKELLKPINQALDRLESIRQRKAFNEDKIILEGLFVLAVASFENSLNDTIKVLLKHIPEKLDIKSVNVSKEDLIEEDALMKAIDNRINSISYKNLKETITYFINTTGINEGTIFTDLFDKLQEIKATRNLLIHNNLKINNIYIEMAGPLRREGRHNGQLEVVQDYLYQSIVTLRAILQEFKNSLEEKYKNYTYVNAVKRLWEFMFTTPIMKFENEWKIDKKKDIIHSYNEEKSRRGALSSGEEILFNVWLTHFQGDELKIDRSNFYALDSDNRKKLAYLLTVIDILKAR